MAAIICKKSFICHLIPNIPHTFPYDALASRYKQLQLTLTFSRRTVSQSDGQQVNKKTGWSTRMVQVLPNIRGGEAKCQVEWDTFRLPDKTDRPFLDREAKQKSEQMWLDTPRRAALQLPCNTPHRTNQNSENNDTTKYGASALNVQNSVSYHLQYWSS